MISGPFRGQRLNTLGGHMEVIKKRVNKFGTRSVKQISPKLLTLISPKMFTLISPRTSWRRWYFKRLKRIYIPYELFLIFLAIFTVRVGMSLLNINWLLLAFGLQGTNVGVLGAEQTWFISSLLICYLLTPAINGLYEQITNKYLFLIVVLVFPLVLLMLREVWAFTLLSPLSEYAIGIYLGKNNIENKLANKRLPMMMLLLVMAFSFRVAGRV